MFATSKVGVAGGVAAVAAAVEKLLIKIKHLHYFGCSMRPELGKHPDFPGRPAVTAAAAGGTCEK